MVDLSEASAIPVTTEAVVEPRFIDANGHMNVAWYVHLFDRAVWAFFSSHGLDQDYRRRGNAGMFALEETVRYLSEVREGDALEVRMGVLEQRPKTLRLLQYMVDSARQKVSAVREVVAVHIDLGTRRSAPFPEDVLVRLRAAPTARTPGGAMNDAAAKRFARAWIEAWNRRDIEEVLSHYADDALFVSPTAEAVIGKGHVAGKDELRRYWQAASGRIGKLVFALDEALWSAGDQTLTVLYRTTVDDNPPRRAVEVMRFARDRITKGEALYGALAEADGSP